MKTLKYFTLTISTLLFTACSDGSISQINDNSILEQDTKCLKLVVFPPKQSISQALENLYKFDKDCELSLVVSYKTGIVCNSNQNLDKKVKGLPDAYLRLEIKKGTRLYYSYYKDLPDALDDVDIKKAFKELKTTLDIHP